MAGRGGSVTVWTKARQDVLRREYRNGNAALILAEINALPGRRIPSWASVRRQANALGLERAHDGKPRGKALVAAEFAKTRYTPEREALFRQHRAAGTTYADLFPMLNALPGPPFGLPLQLRVWAKMLGLGHSVALLASGRLRAKFSPERIEVIRQGCIAGTPWPSMMALVNALPGPQFADYRRLYDRACDLGFLKLRPRGRQACAYSLNIQAAQTPRPPRQSRVMAAPKPRAPKPPRPPAPPRFMPPRAAPPPLPVVLTAEEVDARMEARRAAVRAALAKRAPDLSALANAHRLPLREVIRLQAEVRQAARAA